MMMGSEADLVRIDKLRVELNEIVQQISKLTNENVEQKTLLKENYSKLENMMTETISAAGSTLNFLHEISKADSNEYDDIFKVDSNEEAWNEEPLIKVEVDENEIVIEEEQGIEAGTVAIAYAEDLMPEHFGDEYTSIEENSGFPFYCELCEKSFSSKGTFKRHQMFHTGDKPFKCQVCSKSYTLKSHLKRHEFTHTGLKPHSCEVCTKSFADKVDLKKHMRIHTVKGKNYTCEECLRSFANEDALHRHRATHMTSEPYDGEEAGTGDPLISDILEVNMANAAEDEYENEMEEETKDSLNIEIKPEIVDPTFEDLDESKSFPMKSFLFEDKMLHTGDKPFACELCDKSYKLKSHLKRHMYSHTGEKPHSCEVCGKGFADKSDMKKHMRVHY